MNKRLLTPIEFLRGVGPKRADLLRKELNISTFEDLLFYFPFRYIDRSQVYQISELIEQGNPVQLRGRISEIYESGSGRNKRLHARFHDLSGMIELVWYQGIRFIKPMLKANEELIIYGRIKRFGNKWNMAHPEITAVKDAELSGFQPVYSSTELLSQNGLHSKGIHKLIQELLPQVISELTESLPDSFRDEYALIGKNEAIQAIHLPDSMQDAERAQYRIKFEELFFLQLELLVRKQITATKSTGFMMEKVGTYFNTFYKSHLPFELTNAQKRVLKEIRSDIMTGHHMNRLLQGDVGSGKTLVALLSMLLALDNGFQAAMMAPTEILATQHYHTIHSMLEAMGLRVALLTGSTRKKDREHLHEALQNGTIHILIGTHALLESEVKFKNLGLVVIDEQHRFGVAQRARMRKKNKLAPHILIMTATPIPRTLAMTFYGDLEVSVIDELPPGRKAITTTHRYESSRLRLFGFMKEEIAKGRQVYIVYPLIAESEKLDFNNLQQGFEAISRAFPLPDYKVGILHGKMKAADKDFEMNRFVRGETTILVATTVIEVGVNVPNASIMVIESAERFGLSQLHQLRGRVGRGAEQSYCILMTGDKLSPESKKRMDTMVRTNDGFEIAEVDLQLRGPGDLMGTQQSGSLNLRLANIARDGHLVGYAREAAKEVLKNDPDLSRPEHVGIRHELSAAIKSRPDWGKIA